jgi:hypothetical protein
MKRMVMGLNRIWRILVSREIEKRGHEIRRAELIKINSIIPQQTFAICLMQNRGQTCFSCLAPADFLKHCKELHGDNPLEDRKSLTKIHSPGIILIKHQGINPQNFCKLTTSQIITDDGSYKYDHPYMTWITNDIIKEKMTFMEEEKKRKNYEEYRSNKERIGKRKNVIKRKIGRDI